MKRLIPSDIERMQFDLLVIGAGINGVAIARDAAMRGLDVLVLDKGDIASGTTSWSTRLIHGGLRYLEHAEIGLVRESLRERERLLRNAPHLVQPLPLVLPIYEGAKRGKGLIRAGMAMYDALSIDKSVPTHRMLNARQTLEIAPALNADGLTGAARYYDAQATNTERLAVESASSATEHGAIVINYARVDRILTEGAVVRGCAFTDLLSGDQIEARAKVVVNVAGPWVDAVLNEAPTDVPRKRYVGGTKGSHLIVRPFPGAPREAIYYEAKTDGRAIFVVPWNNLFLIGSTDIRYEGDLDKVQTGDDEIDYLLRETNALLPGTGLTPDDVLYTYCGVRPLPYKPVGKEGAITRRHVVVNHAPALRGLLSVIGGKLTTHRALAEEVVDDVCKTLDRRANCVTDRTPLPGAAGLEVESFRRSMKARHPGQSELVDRLVDIYGSRARTILELASTDPVLSQAFDSVTGAIAAEIVYTTRHEAAVTLADILLRRTMVGLAAHAGVGPDERAARIAATELGWDEDRIRREVAEYRSYLQRFRPRALLNTPASVA